jgi:hypothetical protein
MIHDTQSNSVSAINIQEAVAFRAFPGILPKFGVYLLIEREAEDERTPTVSFAIALAGKTMISREGTKIDFGDKIRTRLIVNIAGLVIPEPGRLEAKLKFDVTGEVMTYSLDCRLEPDVTPEVTVQES